jgi:hypothetical protein
VTDDSLYKLLDELKNTEWELDGETILNILLKERLTYDESFATALLHTNDNTILYCNKIFSNYFSCRLKPDIAYLSKSSELPSLNTVGEILMKLREHFCNLIYSLLIHTIIHVHLLTIKSSILYHYLSFYLLCACKNGFVNETTYF